MLISRNREKLVDAIIFFASHTKYCGKTKLIKLLYLLDFEHFRQTGKSVTGLDYFAWELGPVPVKVYQDLDEPPEDLREAVEIVPTRVIDFFRLEVHPKRAFDADNFTKRELGIMETLAQRFRDDQSRPMVNVTHDERGPWAAVWEGGRGQNDRIPYRLAVNATGETRDAVLESAELYEGLAAAQANW